MQSRGKMIGAFASVSAFIGYQFLLHKVTVAGQLTPLTAALVLIPLAVAAGWAIAVELGVRLTIILMSALALIALAAVSLFGLPHPALIFGLPHLTANLFMLWFFARTLKNGREPLITSFARQLARTPLSAELETYTRRVTLAWSLFFALQIAVSLGMYAFGPLEAWSMFINILSGPLVAVMFMSEYTYRVLRFRDPDQSSLVASLQVFARESAASKSAKAR